LTNSPKLAEETRIKIDNDGRLEFYLKYIEKAELDPKSIHQKDLTWEGYSQAHNLVLPKEIVDHLDFNRIPLHSKPDIQQILTDQFGTSDLGEIQSHLRQKFKRT